MERELDFTPQFVPSADSPVRCRFYSSMAYTSAKKVILFLSDSGPLGLWKQDPENTKLTIDHKWSMTPYFSRAQEEGFGIVVCNPFSNTAVVYEAGGFEREVPVPNSSSPKEHVLFVWEQFITKCKGQVSIIAYARGGALVKSILETYEDSVREKVYRIALIESKHEIDHNESPGILELLGRRSINWEASYEPLGAQIEADNTPKTLEKAEDPAFAFIGANPNQPGMTAVVKHVRADFSDAAISLINGLLTRDPMMRLGSGPRGADEVLTHPFFDSIDWPELLERKMQPPFNPGVGKMDTHYAPRNMNEITARDREPSMMMQKTDRPNDFDGFSFVGRPSSLSNVG
ncbi:Cotranscriptional regulator FAM172A-like protein [Phytophthora ramorum]|uniref:Cotranscriptional regulator FAM172A-like protein n=1 Tax=Phytophthora ramorum TaxID=164328 RepID=UPI0030A7D638|nr:Cotranscriptional regulator FAM172A-like protein [Phytophthora ramorum]